VPRVLFVMNPTQNDVVAKVALRGARALVDVLAAHEDEASVTRGLGGFEVSVPSRTVRMFSVEA
jgi:hypothetical protein